MRSVMLIATALVLAEPCFAQVQDKMPAPSFQGALVSPNEEDAQAFVAGAEAEFNALQQRYNRIQWIGITFISDDTTWLKAKVDAEFKRLQAAKAKQAAAFDEVDVDPAEPETAILKRQLELPPPGLPGAAEHFRRSPSALKLCIQPAELLTMASS